VGGHDPGRAVAFDPDARVHLGAHVNGPIARVLGWFYFGLICVLAVAAPILFVWTNGGS
jgi:hypothetical protein